MSVGNKLKTALVGTSAERVTAPLQQLPFGATFDETDTGGAWRVGALAGSPLPGTARVWEYVAGNAGVAIDIYADATLGNDANPGTAALPVQTLRRAEELLPTTVTGAAVIHLAAGTYNDPSVILAIGGPFAAGPSGVPLIILGAFEDAGYGPQIAQGGSGGFTVVTALNLAPGTDLAGTFLSLPNSGSTDLKAVARNTTGPGSVITLCDSVTLNPGDPFTIEEPSVDIALTPFVVGPRVVGFYGCKFVGLGAAGLYGGTLVCDSCVFDNSTAIALSAGTLLFLGLSSFPSPFAGTTLGSSNSLSPSALINAQPIQVADGSHATVSFVSRTTGGTVLAAAGRSVVSVGFVDADGGGMQVQQSVLDIVSISGGSPAMRIATTTGVGVSLLGNSTSTLLSNGPSFDLGTNDTGVLVAQDSSVTMATIAFSGCTTAGVIGMSGSSVEADRITCTGCGQGIVLDQSVAAFNDTVVTGSTGHGIVAADTTNLVMQGGNVSGNGLDGIHATNGSGGDIRGTICGGNGGAGVAAIGGCQFDMDTVTGAANGTYGLDIGYRSGVTAVACAVTGATNDVRLGAAAGQTWATVQTADGANDLVPVAPFIVSQLCFASNP